MAAQEATRIQATRKQPASPTEGNSAQETAQRLAYQLETAKSKNKVTDTDPQAVTTHLVAELAAEEANASQ